MNSDWHLYTLGDLTVNFDGKRKPVKGPDRVKGIYPYYGASGIVDYVDGYLFDGEYLLVAEDGENLRTRQTPIAFMANGRFWVNNHAHIVTGNELADTRFLMYALLNTDVNSFLTGAVMPKLTQGNLNKIPIYCPSLKTQRRIVNILGAFDDKIKNNSQTNKTLESIAQTIFKSWFIDFDPVHAKVKAIKEGRDPELAAMATIAGKTEAEIQKLTGKGSKLADTLLQLDDLRHIASLFPKEFVKSEIGSIPKGWNTIAIYELGTYINGAAYKAFSPNEEQSGLPIVKIAELKSGITAQTRYSAVKMPEKYKIGVGDILFSWSGNPETSIDTFVWTYNTAWLNQHIFKVIPKETEERSFLLLSLKCLKPIFTEIARNKQTTGLGHVTVSDLKGLRITKPENLILKKWDEFISPIIKSVLNRELEKQTLIGLRDAILPKLISGEISINKIDPIDHDLPTETNLTECQDGN